MDLCRCIEYRGMDQNMHKEMGSFIPLELSSKKEYHGELIAVNSGRSAFDLVFQKYDIRKVWIPALICDAVIEAVRRARIPYDFYLLNEDFMPKTEIQLGDNDWIICVNYFDLFRNNVSNMHQIYKRVLVDCVQSFFYKPQMDCPTVYSCRKFFGVADGGYAQVNDNKFDMEQDVSWERYGFLLQRLDSPTNLPCRAGYLGNEKKIAQSGLKRMSRLTQSMMSSIDYKRVIRKRQENFKYLHQQLGAINQYPIAELFESVPMIYPLLISKCKMQERLADSGIYTARFWAEVLGRVPEDSWEAWWVSNLIPLPIDQRYDLQDMEYLADVVLQTIKK